MTPQQHNESQPNLQKFWAAMGLDILTIMVHSFDLPAHESPRYGLEKLSMDKEGYQTISTILCQTERTRDSLVALAEEEQRKAKKVLFNLAIRRHMEGI